MSDLAAPASPAPVPDAQPVPDPQAAPVPAAPTAGPATAHARRRARVPSVAEAEVFEESMLGLAAAPLPPEVQKVYGELVTLYDGLSVAVNPVLYQQAHLAATLMTGDQPKLDAAQRIVDELRAQTTGTTPVYSVIQGVLCFLGLGVLMALAVMGLLAMDSPHEDFIRAYGAYGVAALFGGLGAIVSIFLRIKSYETASLRSRPFLEMTGFCLPVVGTVFAVVISAIFMAGIVNLGVQAPSPGATLNLSFFVVLGFVSGFSERFALRMLGTVEGKFDGSAPSQQAVKPGGAPTGTT